MDEFELKRIIYDYIKEICHYSQMQVFSTSSYQRNFFQLQIDDDINGLINFLMERDELTRQQIYLANQVEEIQQEEQRNQENLNHGSEIPEPTQQAEELPVPSEPDSVEEENRMDSRQNQMGETTVPRSVTMEELTQSDGREGRKAYVAVDGKVYDVSQVTRWAGGNHFGLTAGNDLTEEFNGCHNAIYDRLMRLPMVGVLQK